MSPPLDSELKEWKDSIATLYSGRTGQERSPKMQTLVDPQGGSPEIYRWLLKLGLDELAAQQTTARFVEDGYTTVQDVKRLAGAKDGSAELTRLPKFFMKLAHLDRVKAASQDSLLEQQILNDVVTGAAVDWKDVAGLTLAKQTLQEAVILPQLQPQLFSSPLRQPPLGVLLFGPPGTGKTMLAEAVAGAAAATFFSISAASINSRWFGESEKLVRALFSVARQQEQAVIFIDEIDALLNTRAGGEDEAARRVKTEFMIQLDGLSARQSGHGRLLVIAATNRPWDLDQAALRRFAKRVYVPLPDSAGRRQLLDRLLRQDGELGMALQELDELVLNTAGYSCSDIFELCREASSERLRGLDLWQRAPATVGAEEVTPICAVHFAAALTIIRASVAQGSLVAYDEWNRALGSGVERQVNPKLHAAATESSSTSVSTAHEAVSNQSLSKL